MTKSHSQDQSSIVLYKSDDDSISFNVNVFEDTVWLTQKQMSELFCTTVQNLGQHIKSIFEDRELYKHRTIKKFFIVQKEGNRSIQRELDHYNLDMIISVGYRVQSKKATQFRQWATKILKAHLINGYSVNETRIKQIESSLSELVKSDKIKTNEIAEIKDLLKQLINRPIIIQNHNKISLENKISLQNKDLEKKIISLIDKIIENLEEKKVITKLEKVKKDVSSFSNNTGAKKRLLSFFKELGDDKSTLHKTLKGAKIAKNIVSELVKLGNKFREFL